jgi:hypothetical protein
LKTIVQTPKPLFSVFKNYFRKHFAKHFFNKKTTENDFLFLFLKTILKNKNKNRFAKRALNFLKRSCRTVSTINGPAPTRIGSQLNPSTKLANQSFVDT